MSDLHVCSHSFANGGGNSFCFTKSAEVLGLTLQNHAVNGSMLFDQVVQAYALTPGAHDYLIFLGTNDQWKYSVNADRLAAFTNGLYTVARYLASSVTLGTSGTVTYGDWYDNQPWTVGKASQVVGSKLTLSFSGDATDFAYTVQGCSGSAAMGLKVDEQIPSSPNPSSVNGYTSADMTTYLGKGYGPASVHLSGFGSGSHTLEIEHTGAGYVYADWIGGAMNDARVWLATPPRYQAAGYTLNGGSDANMADYAQGVRDTVDLLRNRGFTNVNLIDFHATMDPDIHIRSDDHLHPTDGGQGRMLVDTVIALQ